MRWQTAFLRDAEPVLLEYLHGIGEELVHQLLTDDRSEHPDILAAIDELRVDASKAILRRLSEADYPYSAQAVRCLRWSRDERAGMALRGLARKWLSTGWAVTSWLGGTESSKPDELITAILFALRGHPGAETEELLLRCTQHHSPQVQLAAFQSLGWSEPLDRDGVINALSIAQRSSRAVLRRAALAIQARLGECVALTVTRKALCGSDPASVHEMIDLIAEEDLTWLWPDLDLLTESEDPSIASHAWEAIERMRKSVWAVTGVKQEWSFGSASRGFFHVWARRLASFVCRHSVTERRLRMGSAKIVYPRSAAPRSTTGDQYLQQFPNSHFRGTHATASTDSLKRSSLICEQPVTVSIRSEGVTTFSGGS